VGRSHRSEIIEEAEPDSLGDRLASITGDTPAMEKSAQEEIHRLRADLAKVDERLSQKISNLEKRLNARPDTDTLRDEAIEAAKEELETVESAKEEALDEFESTTEGLQDRLIRESKRAAKNQIDEQNKAINESLRQMAIMLSTLPTKTKAQCPKCGSYVRFKEAHKVGGGGTNLTCPDCTTQLIKELPPSVDSNDSKYV
jgi:DNA repair exonuclease SbcCD ATPase subunit